MNNSVNPDDLYKEIITLKNDAMSARYTREQLKEKHLSLYSKSMHLYDAVISGKLDYTMLSTMIDNLKLRNKSKDNGDKVDRHMGKVFAKKYLYPQIGVQPDLTEEQENVFIEKIKKEQEQEKETLRKLNAGEITREELKSHKIEMN